MVKCADRIAEGASGKIACDRHQRLKQPERGGGLYRLPAAESPVGKPVGEGNGKRIHRKPHCDQKQFYNPHGKSVPFFCKNYLWAVNPTPYLPTEQSA